MNEPLLHAAATTAEEQSLWNKAPAWRNLVVTASLLTTVALALPLMPEPKTHATAAATVVTAKPHAVQMAAVAAAPPPAQPVPTAPAPLAVHKLASVAHDTAQPLIPHAQPAPEQLASAAPQPAAQPASVNAPAGLRDLPSGVLTVVNQHNRHLMGQDWPVTITVIAQPAHGHIITRTVSAPFRSFSGEVQIRAVTQVLYQSDPGYTGTDSFSYKRTSEDPTDPWNPNMYNMTFNVK
jgi:hypothetical protein